jgi:predicted transcriptional regulator
MMTMTIKLANEQHERLRQLAKQKGVTVSQFLKELSNIAVAQFDAETRFRAMARKGNPARGLKLLSKLDRAFAGK